MRNIQINGGRQQEQQRSKPWLKDRSSKRRPKGKTQRSTAAAMKSRLN
jgi:hypothetical protein